MKTISIFLLSAWNVLVDTIQSLSQYMGVHTSYIVIFLICIMFLQFVQFVFRRLRFH